jgi:SSS family solute:Na+ symporter
MKAAKKLPRDPVFTNRPPDLRAGCSPIAPKFDTLGAKKQEPSEADPCSISLDRRPARSHPDRHAPGRSLFAGTPGRHYTAAARPVKENGGFSMMLLASTATSVSASIRGPDYVMLVGYFLLMLGIGAYFYRFMRGMKVYFTGGNRIPWWLSGVSFYMSSFSAYAFVVFSGLCFRYGWVGVTIFWCTVPATLFSALLFAARWRRARIDSPVEFLESRYSALVRQLFAWTGVPVGIIDDSLKLIATGTIVHVGMGFSIETSVIVCGAIMVAYTFLGGLWAVTVTDFVQFVILAVAVVVVFPLAVGKAGGFGAMTDNSPAGFFALTTEKYNWFYIALMVVLYSIAYSSTNWHLIQKYFCVATQRDAKKVGWLVVALNIVGPPLILTPAMAARQFLPTDIIDKEVYPRLCAAILPAGMLGLIIAAMFSATMANLSSHFNVRASVLTNDVYRRLLRPRASEKELVLTGRAMTALVGGVTVLTALYLAHASAPKLFTIMATLFGCVVAPMGLPMLAGILSRRVTTLSATTALIGGSALSIALYFLLPEGGSLWGIHWEREVVILAVSAVAVILIMAGLSALLPMGPEEKKRVEMFHQRLDMPIGALPEDKPSEVDQVQGVSPFRIVGTCVACIGALMLCVQPFISGRLPLVLNVVLGLTLISIGVLMVRFSRGGKA